MNVSDIIKRHDVHRLATDIYVHIRNGEPVRLSSDEARVMVDTLELDAVEQSDKPVETIQEAINDYKSSTSLCVTIPNKSEFDIGGQESISTALNRIIVNAKESVTVVSPFIDARGFDIILNSLKEAHSNGATINIISRELSDESENHQIVRNITEELDTNVNFFEYNSPEKGARFHSKFILADDTVCLMSSNITRAGLRDNFELGITTSSQETVEQVREYVDNICHSENCTLRFSQNHSSDSGGR